MGADSNSNATSRLITLQNRKHMLEESILTKNHELRALCIQEAELTGIMPSEVPLEPGESLPPFRRRVGTAFEYPQNLINKLNNEDESIAALETGIQFQRRILEDALRLANDAAYTKEKRKNTIIYEQTKQLIKDMEEKLELVKSQTYGTQPPTTNNQHLKQKKKPRPPFKSDMNSLRNNNVTSHPDEMNNSHVYHHTLPHRTDLSHLTLDLESERYMPSRENIIYRNTNTYSNDRDLQHRNSNFIRPESGLKDRRGSGSSNNSAHIPSHIYSNSHSNPNIYQPQLHPTHIQAHSTHISHPTHTSHTLPLNTHLLTSTSQLSSPSSQFQVPLSQPGHNYPTHSHTLQHSPSRPKAYEEDTRKLVTDSVHQDPYTYCSQQTLNVNTSSQSHKLYGIEAHSFPNMMNQHSVPHYQQYEPEVLSIGLGGHWLKNENGESVWVTSVPHMDMHVNWPRDKRFGSLDRRKEKFTNNKHTSPTLESVGKTSTIRSLGNPQPEPVRISTLQPVKNTIRSSGRHDNRQLVRTQSLGSVGAQAAEVWPSDDNSSCDSDGHSINERSATSSRKCKPKGWCETSLDVPQSHSSNLLNTGLLEEESYSPDHRTSSRTSFPSPQNITSILEIPAESNPSPMHPEANIEMFNNNVLTDLPKNCTVVQAGQFKPYREVTKPFEMKDFYKYSTKFRERKQEGNKVPVKVMSSAEATKSKEMQYGTLKDNLNINNPGYENCEGQDDVDASGMVQKSIYQPLQPMKCQPFSPPNNFNRSYTSIGSTESDNKSLDTSLALATTNVSEHFSAEMNAWYQNHGRVPVDSGTTTNTSSVGRSTATLV